MSPYLPKFILSQVFFSPFWGYYTTNRSADQTFGTFGQKYDTFGKARRHLPIRLLSLVVCRNQIDGKIRPSGIAADSLHESRVVKLGHSNRARRMILLGHSDQMRALSFLFVQLVRELKKTCADRETTWLAIIHRLKPNTFQYLFTEEDWHQIYTEFAQ